MRSIRYHKYLPIACLYFFINAPIFFPEGLLITSILSPAFYFWLLLKRRRHVLERYFIVVFPWFLAETLTGMHAKNFIISFALLMTCYVTVYAFAVAISELHHLDELMETIIWLNLGLAFLGLLVRFTSYYSLMWQIPENLNDVSANKSVRFSGFTYEPSYYCTLLTPLVLYAWWRFETRRDKQSVWLLLALLFPLAMSLSFGAIGDMAVSTLLVYFFFGRGFVRVKWAFALSAVLLIGFLILPSTSYVKQRTISILTGNDRSGSIRTVESYYAAWRMAKQQDVLFGVGLGEIKDYAHEYMTWTAQNKNATLPSAIAETLGETGILGLLLRFFLEFYFFRRTRPDRDPYRLSLFIWAFIFQFGGSYKDNLAEYMVWILAFSPTASFFSQPNPEAVEEPLTLHTVPESA